MNTENVQNKLFDIFGNMSGNFNILEEQIDVDVQMEYFEFSKKFRKRVDKDDILKDIDRLFDVEVTDDEKRSLLIKLALVDEVQAYRAIEKFCNTDRGELHAWSALALQESRMLIESSLLGESQVFISTGLGGKGTNLRYFIVLTSNTGSEFTQVQKKLIKNEFDFTLKNNKSELEEVNFDEYFATILALIPIDSNIRIILRKAVDECNQIGNFISTNFIVTNVKIMSMDEIKDFLQNEKSSQN